LKISKDGIDLIKSFEGLRLEAYLDSVGIPTIGYGHTKGVKLGQKITEQEAEDLLRNDLDEFERGVSSLIRNAKQNQFDAMVSLAFNVGLGNFKKSSVLKWFNLGEYQTAADSFLLWNKAGGQVLPGLTRRRKAERELFLKQPNLVNIEPKPPEYIV
jgi:lysozyme